MFWEGIVMYAWLTEALERDFQLLRLMKKTDRGSVSVVRHIVTGKVFILRRFQGSPAVYRALLSVTSPYLPQVLEVASQWEENLVLEEFIQGDNMGNLLQGSLFTAEETRQIGGQLCQALWVLHSLRIVHRDVKPENIILRGRDAVLIDFDAARFYQPGQSADTRVLGTTGFAAPEQYGLSQSDHRTDIYSMGVLLNVMLTGEHPSRKLAPGRWGRIVTRCTQVNPEKRYQTILHLSEAIM